ncbi:hypothetical protein CPB83DRAFT_840252 [Crepidotus variabilis]|uniref:Uncharacterized protein n=1 Tax=Crepidotus variabilis TaxID=179855 RepID=A0A9P6E5E7_9AGAR|nr:hypothetical protein CPB83DRAFT_840252 [Crepidotus variabilis]
MLDFDQLPSDFVEALDLLNDELTRLVPVRYKEDSGGEHTFDHPASISVLDTDNCSRLWGASSHEETSRWAGNTPSLSHPLPTPYPFSVNANRDTPHLLQRPRTLHDKNGAGSPPRPEHPFNILAMSLPAAAIIAPVPQAQAQNTPTSIPSTYQPHVQQRPSDLEAPSAPLLFRHRLTAVLQATGGPKPYSRPQASFHPRHHSSLNTLGLASPVENIKSCRQDLHFMSDESTVVKFSPSFSEKLTGYSRLSLVPIPLIIGHLHFRNLKNHLLASGMLFYGHAKALGIRRRETYSEDLTPKIKVKLQIKRSPAFNNVSMLDDF